MPRKAEDVILELEMKRKMRKQLREVRLQRLDEEGSRFLEPFKDVLRALRLAAMDVSNSLRLAIGLLFTFDPQKIKKKIDAFDERRQKINIEWKPIVDRAKQAIKGADSILVMSIIGPANFLAMQGVGASLLAGKTVAEVATATNWDSLINSWNVKLDLNQGVQQFFQKYDKRESEREERAARRSKMGRGKLLQRRLSRLFSAGGDYGDALYEQVTPRKIDEPKITEKEAIDMFVKATTMDKRFKELQDQQKQNLKDTIPSIQADLEPLGAVSNMFAATDVESFKKAVQQAKSINPKLKEEPFDKFIAQVQSETQKMLKDPMAAENAKKLSGGKELSPEELQKTIEKSVFSMLKSQFDKQVAKTIKDARDAAKSAIEALKIDDKALKAMDESPDLEFKEMSSIYKKLLKTYDTINTDYESKAKSRMA